MEEGLVIKSDKEWIQYFRSRVSGIIPFYVNGDCSCDSFQL